MTRQRRLSFTTVLLAALAVALGLYVYVMEVRIGGQRERAIEASTHLLPFDSEAATEIVIERPGQRIVCRKEGERWRIAAPIRSDADDTRITRLLEDIAKAKVERSISARSADLAVYGLAHPTVLTVASGNARQSIEVGKANPTDNFVFARRGAGAPVLLVERRLRNAADETLFDLREKEIFAFSPDDVQQLTFIRRGQRVRLVRRPGAPGEAHGGWSLAEPLRARADRGLIERALELSSTVRAEEFVSETPEHLARYGLDSPWGSVRFDLKAGRPELLLFGRKTTENALTRYYARRPGPGPVFTINDNEPADAQRSPAEWRERHIADFDRADAAELRLITPARTVVCVKVEDPKGEEWRMAEYTGPVGEGMNLGAAAKMPNALHADRDRMEDLLAHLSTLQVAGFLDGAAPGEPRFGLTRPALKIVALDKTGKPLASVSFGARQGARYYATGPHLGGVFLVSTGDADRFRVGMDNLAARS